LTPRFLSLTKSFREHELQNPKNKREIFLDEAMQEVFECETFTMFSMNKYIGAHIDPFKPVDLTTNSSTPTRTTRTKRKAAPAAKSGEKRPRKVGTQPPWLLTPELEAVVGVSALPRPQVVSKIWEYIKANDLQNPADKREIICDEKLKKVMKRDKVTMFSMNKLITPHLIEKVAKTEES
jgi:upstream activation factor subunit UAF30